METFSNKPWNWRLLSQHPDLTLNLISKNINKPWSWDEIFKNPFNKEKEDIKILKYRQHLAAFKIQNRWKNARVNPNCLLGINKINRDYDECFL